MSTSKNTKHYDSSLEYSITMYDNLPYERDESVCGSAHVAVYSGNIIKYYACRDDGPYIISHQNATTKAYLSKQEQKILNKIQKEHEDYIQDAIEEGLAEYNEEES